MEKHEIIAGNILIAEFMGGKYARDVEWVMNKADIWLPHLGVYHTRTIDTGMGKILQYHNSWDWLIPVISKCEQSNFSRWDKDYRPLLIKYIFENKIALAHIAITECLTYHTK